MSRIIQKYSQEPPGRRLLNNRHFCLHAGLPVQASAFAWLEPAAKTLRTRAVQQIKRKAAPKDGLFRPATLAEARARQSQISIFPGPAPCCIALTTRLPPRITWRPARVRPPSLNILFRLFGPPFLLNALPCAFACLGLRCLDPNRPVKKFRTRAVQQIKRKAAPKDGQNSPARVRTTDPVVNSHLLCQLSYRG